MNSDLREKPRTLGSIQVLRGVAAIAVVIHHTCAVFREFKLPSFLAYWRQFEDLGACGVDIFFVISGFIMIYISRKKFGSEKAAGEFMKHRIRRVVPLYWVYTTAMVLIAVGMHWLKGRVFPTALIVRSYFFIPTIDRSTHQLELILAQGWTLQYEMLFYVLFAVWLAAGSIRTVRFYLTISISAIFLLSTFLHGFFPNNPLVLFAANPVMFEFVFGVFIGCALTGGKFPGHRPGKVLIALAIAGFATTLFTPIPLRYRIFFWGVPAALLVIGALANDRGGKRTFPQVLGDWSYSIYLSHLFVVQAAISIVRRHSPHSAFGGDLIVAVIVVLSVVGGGVSYVLIEKPITDSLRSRKRNTAMAVVQQGRLP